MDPARTPLTVAPAPPRLTARAADFTSPVAVTAAYMAAWCYQPVASPANQDIATAAQWVTAAGFASDKTHGVTNEQWAATVAAGITAVCGPVEVYLAPDMPAGTTTAWVEVDARQAFVNRQGKIIGQQTVSQTRRVLKAPDGRWLVDVQVSAG